jgi:hypothetical protein
MISTSYVRLAALDEGIIYHATINFESGSTQYSAEQEAVAKAEV